MWCALDGLQHSRHWGYGPSTSWATSPLPPKRVEEGAGVWCNRCILMILHDASAGVMVRQWASPVPCRATSLVMMPMGADRAHQAARRRCGGARGPSSRAIGRRRTGAPLCAGSSFAGGYGPLPGTPGTPETPGTPDTPGTPGTPDTPETLDTPDTGRFLFLAISPHFCHTAFAVTAVFRIFKFIRLQGRFPSPI